MEVKNAEKSNLLEIKNLWAEAFCEQEPFLSWYFDNFWCANDSLCIKTEENELAGALTLIPHDLFVNGKVIKSSYIAGVSVPENMRMKGIATRLMKNALLFQINRGETISLLIPFNYDFYRKMGYEVCYERKIVPCDDFQDKDVKNIKELDFSYVNQMNELYEKFCADKNGYILRKTYDWEYVLNRLPEQNTKSLGYFKDDKLSAYCVYVKEKDRTVIHELIGNPEAKKALVSLIKKNNDCVVLYLSIEQNEVENCKIVPTVMARVTSVSFAIKKLPKLPVRIKIIDDFLEENNGIFEIGEGRILDENSFDLCADIKYFTQWFMGFKSAKELLFDKKISGNTKCAEMLDEIVKQQTNYINLIMSEDF